MEAPTSATNPPEYQLRAAGAADAPFFFALRAAVMGPLWRAEFGKANWIEHHLDGPPEDFQADDTRIAMVGAERVGVLQVAPWKRALTIQLLMIDPAFQRRGIGTHLIRLVQREAFEQGRYVLLEMLPSNLDAKRLYERLGFGTAIQLPHSTWMQWSSRQPATS